MAPTIASQPPVASWLRTNNAHGKKGQSNTRGIWSSLLESAASGRRLDEKTLVVLGGGVEAQNDLIAQIPRAQRNTTTYRRGFRDRAEQRQPVLANRFALGYTYLDITDDDQDDFLCRLSVHLLPETHPAFTPFLEPLFTPAVIPDTLVIVMLDWNEPWNWMVQLRDRIRMIKTVLDSADAQCQEAMEENMKAWSERRKGPAAEDVTNQSTLPGMPPTLGPGTWETPLGVPLCVVCFNAERTRILEMEHGWKDKEFDMVMQYLRTVLLRHGSSLIYTSSSDHGSLQCLLRSSLGIQSTSRKTTLRHNITERDKVLIPPNWDSWGNIKAQADRFDPQTVSNAWVIDLLVPDQAQVAAGDVERSEEDKRRANFKSLSVLDPNGAAAMFEKAMNRSLYPPLIDPLRKTITLKEPVLRSPNYQEFLAKQAERLQVYKQEEEVAKNERLERRRQRMGTYSTGGLNLSQRLGPVQTNVSGVQVNAEEALEALQERAANRAAIEAEEAAQVAADAEKEEEKMRSFFASLKVEPRSTRRQADVT